MRTELADVFAGYLLDNYGLSASVFADCSWFTREGRADLWLLRGNLPLSTLPDSVHTAGIRVFDAAPPSGYPSSTFLRRFHHVATRGVVDLDAENATAFMRGETVEIERRTPRGYAIVQFDGVFLGRGFATGEGQLRSQVNKQLRRTYEIERP